MKEIRKPRIGLAAVMSTPFRGDKQDNYHSHCATLGKMAAKLDFELNVFQQGIYSLEQAGAAANEFRAWKADFIILQAASFASGDFIYPFAQSPIRMGLWAVPEGPATAGGGLPLNSFTTVNLYNSIIRTRMTGYPWPVKWFFGEPGQPLFDSRLEVTVCALRALLNLDGSRIGLVGGVAPSFDNLIVDDDKLKERLGITVEHFEFDQFLEVIRGVSEERAGERAAGIRSSARSFAADQDESLRKSGRVEQAVWELTQEHALDAIAISCWPRFQSTLKLAVCTVLGDLNTNGLVAACEGDVTSAVGMLMLHYMTNGEVTTMMDLASIDPSDESILLWHCGPASPVLADDRGVRMQPLWLFDTAEGGRIGLHNDMTLKPGPASVMGFTTDFDRMLILSGEVDNAKPGYTGSRGWLRALRLNDEPVTTSSLAETLMASGYQHHYPLACTDLSPVGLELCAWLGIEPLKAVKYSLAVK
jgi:hypothetical protein